MEKHDFYLVEEVAEILRVNKMTIYRWIKAGKLKASRIGKVYRITKLEFEKLITETTLNQYERKDQSKKQ